MNYHVPLSPLLCGASDIATHLGVPRAQARLTLARLVAGGLTSAVRGNAVGYLARDIDAALAREANHGERA